MLCQYVTPLDEILYHYFPCKCDQIYTFIAQNLAPTPNKSIKQFSVYVGLSWGNENWKPDIKNKQRL